MQRFISHGLATFLLGATALGFSAAAEAGVIKSAVAVVRSFEQPLEFEFASSDVSELADRPKIVGVEVDWTATSGGAGSERPVLAGLAITSFELGDRIDEALDIALPRNGDSPRSSRSGSFDPDGLSIGQSLIEELLQDGDGSITASLFASGSGVEALTEFFDNGGTLEARLWLTSDVPNVPPTGPSGGGNVPEPAALTMWATTGVIGLAYYIRNQHQARRMSRRGSRIET